MTRHYYGRGVGHFARKRREQQRLYEQAEKFDAAKAEAMQRSAQQQPHHGAEHQQRPADQVEAPAAAGSPERR